MLDHVIKRGRSITTYLSLEHELSCKFYRKGIPEGQDMTKGTMPVSLRREVEEEKPGLLDIYHSTSLLM